MESLKILKEANILKIFVDGHEIQGVISYTLEQKPGFSSPELTVKTIVIGEIEIDL